ncbi:MAG TPA: methyltransferase domain-containing protein [Methylomirabilota bacterium]|nr:methyltransferase domain-containing protein [Methylomirabilota bacterium]
MTNRLQSQKSAAEKFIQPTKWNPADYAANSSVQQTWARELIAKLNLRGDEHLLDVGCGDGKVTAEIARAVPDGSATGIDDSPQMIEFAKKTFSPGKFPNVRFRTMDARKIKFERQFDLVFSNAALHWVDDHQAILRGAASVLKTGGRLVVSCGGKGNAQDVFLALRPEMRLKRWCEFFRKTPKPYFFHAPDDYEKWLPRFGFRIESLKLVPKDATYDGAEGFTAWLRTTWIPYVQRVPENVREEFIAAVTQRYIAKHPPDANGKVHVKMVRLEIDAIKV